MARSSLLAQPIPVLYLSYDTQIANSAYLRGRSVEGSDRAYETIIGLLRISYPELASQIGEEIARGRPTTGARINPEERADRAIGLARASLGRLSQKDVAVGEYSSDDRLLVAVQAVERLVASMQSSRQAVARLLRSHDVQSPVVTFAAPDTPDSAEDTIDLDREAYDAEAALLRIATELHNAVVDLEGQR